jgi:tryptophanase
VTFQPRTFIEPFRIKSVEPLRVTTLDQRQAALRASGYNLFQLKAEDVLIDLLTDSGTSAMSTAQWSAMMLGDEAYAGSSSYFKFEHAVRSLTGFKHILPVHQGRAAERILFEAICKQGDVVVSNTHFDTTRANVEARGAKAKDLLTPEGVQPAARHPFKGNIDLARLSSAITEVGPERIPLCILTVTNNGGGGQPVSMANIRAARELCHSRGIPLFLDACRFAENAWFVKQREPGYADKTPLAIAQEMFRNADGCTMSAKKDGLANIGGFLAMNRDDWAERCRQISIVTEGFPTYGGLAGYDLEAIAVGLTEIVDEAYLRHRIQTTEYFGEQLIAAGVPIVVPTGGHAVYVDARALLPHIPLAQFPAWALGLALYEIAGVRTGEIGSVGFGRRLPDGTEEPAPAELVRLALPRRVYTRSHIDYVVEAMRYLAHTANQIKGVRMVWQAPALRHFTARFERLA